MQLLVTHWLHMTIPAPSFRAFEVRRLSAPAEIVFAWRLRLLARSPQSQNARPSTLRVLHGNSIRIGGVRASLCYSRRRSQRGGWVVSRRATTLERASS